MRHTVLPLPLLLLATALCCVAQHANTHTHAYTHTHRRCRATVWCWPASRRSVIFITTILCGIVMLVCYNINPILVAAFMVVFGECG